MDVRDIKPGQRVGRRIVLECEAKPRQRAKVRILCDCGRESVVYAQTLLDRPNAGCEQCSRAEIQKRLQAEHQVELAAQFPIGWRLGSRVVVGVPYARSRKAWAVPMRCDCGSASDVSVGAIKRGQCGMCLECRKATCGTFLVEKALARSKMDSIREQIEATSKEPDDVQPTAERRFRQAELAELNAKFLYQREARPLCSCGSTRIYEAKAWLQCMRCGKAWSKPKKGKVGT